jgi:hypothetical protein
MLNRIALGLALAAFWGAAVVFAATWVGCGDDEAAACPESLASNAAQWSSPADASDQCVQLARALNASGVTVDAGAGDDCTGTTSQTESGGQCRATITSTCSSGLSFEFNCTVAKQGADCIATIDAPELERPCGLRVLLR